MQVKAPEVSKRTGECGLAQNFRGADRKGGRGQQVIVLTITCHVMSCPFAITWHRWLPVPSSEDCTCTAADKKSYTVVGLFRDNNPSSRLEAIPIRLEAIATRLEAMAIRLETIASRLEAIAILGWKPLLLGWRPSLAGWRPSLAGWRPIASRLEAIASRLEAIASRLEAIASRLEANR